MLDLIEMTNREVCVLMAMAFIVGMIAGSMVVMPKVIRLESELRNKRYRKI